jgi:ligand-binding sensor domain-containing protein
MNNICSNTKYYFKKVSVAKLLCIICTAMMALDLSGQSFNSKNYTIKNGLPSNNVYSIKQDKKGFIWATTDKGVVKYDGKSFKLFTVDQGLASNDNFVMLVDSKDNIWLYSFKAISKIEPTGKCKIFGNTKNILVNFVINSKDEIFYTVKVSSDSFASSHKS